MILLTNHKSWYYLKMMIDLFLEKLKLDNLNEEQKIIKIAQAVSDIPWGEGRNCEEVFEKWIGTCTGKHKVLQICFDKINIKYEPVVCTFKWGEQGIKYPKELQDILNEGEWEHGHNFIKLENDNYLDITWDQSLSQFGFKVLPHDWTPKNSFIGIQNIKQQWDGISIDEKKSQLINSLSPEMKERRERFLNKFIKWIDSIHKGN